MLIYQCNSLYNIFNFFFRINIGIKRTMKNYFNGVLLFNCIWIKDISTNKFYLIYLFNYIYLFLINLIIFG